MQKNNSLTTMYNRTMKLYLVRHGESVFNKQNLHQHAGVPLSPTGEQQAHTAARRFTHLPIDLVITSYMQRARHTAEIINTVTQKDIIQTELLNELKRPTEIEGKSIADPEIMQLKKMLHEHRDDPNWHHSDEENFFDFKNRVAQAIPFIETQQKNHVLVVTHAVVIRMIIALMFLGKSITPEQFHLMEHRLHVANTGITICEKKENGDWHVLTINDYAHVG